MQRLLYWGIFSRFSRRRSRSRCQEPRGRISGSPSPQVVRWSLSPADHRSHALDAFPGLIDPQATRRVLLLWWPLQTLCQSCCSLWYISCFQMLVGGPTASNEIVNRAGNSTPLQTLCTINGWNRQLPMKSSNCAGNSTSLQDLCANIQLTRH